MSLHPSCLMRRNSLLGLSLAIGLIISPVEKTMSQSIVTDRDIVGDGVSLLEIKEQVCALVNLHQLNPLPPMCVSGAGERFVFATSTTSTAGGSIVQWANNLLNPNLLFTDGLLAGDAICQKHADDAGLPGNYKAWLSTDNVDARDRIGDHTWIRRDGQVVAANKTQLLSCDVNAMNECLQNTIQTENFGNQNQFQWTGTWADGTGDYGGQMQKENCLNWTTNNGSYDGYEGVMLGRDYGWTAISNPVACSVSYSIYCFQQ